LAFKNQKRKRTEKVMTDPKYMRAGLGFAQGKAIEEAGEFLAAMGKTQRWGWDSYNPELPAAQRETNAAWVRREMADLRGALNNLEREMEAALTPEPRTAAGSLD
jgi:hypothetical protein